MTLPIVAIVGRPNVGKSSLFNRIAGRRLAVVDDVPGVTRDRLYTPVERCGRCFSLVDTGGLDLSPDDPLVEQVRLQVEVALVEADVVLLLVDVIAGVTPQDREIAERLRRSGKPVVVVAHKADHVGLDMNAAEAYELGYEEVIHVSSIHGRGVGALLDAVARHLPVAPATDADEPAALRIAVVGRPNAGKSSIVNHLIGENRLIVDDRPGTTRDAVNVRFEWSGVPFELVDTAGMRRRSRIDADLERHSVLRATRSIQQSDVAWLILDVTQEIAHQDKAIADFIVRHHRLCVLVGNKWDLVEKDHATYGEYSARVRHQFRAFDHIPIVFTSATTGQRLGKLPELSLALHRAASTRIATPILNDFLRDATMRQSPPAVGGRRCAMKYITQVGILPPTFAVFANIPQAVPAGYKRYLARQLRGAFGFEGVPVRLLFRGPQPSRSQHGSGRRSSG